MLHMLQLTRFLHQSKGIHLKQFGDRHQIFGSVANVIHVHITMYIITTEIIEDTLNVPVTIQEHAVHWLS